MTRQRIKSRAATLKPATPLMALAAKKTAAAKKVPPAATDTASVGKVVGTKVTQMPQSQAAGALAQGIYLYANDVWAQRYFDPNDLHSVERILFGG